MRAWSRPSFVLLALAFAGACGTATATPDERLDAGAATSGVTGTATTTTTGPTSTSSSSSGVGGSDGGGGVWSGPIGGERPVEVVVPPGYDPAKPAPLLLLLHGYVAGGGLQEVYLDLEPEAAARGYLFAQPFGTTDKTGLPFWNATDACCNFYGSTVDDSAYLAMVIAQIRQAYSVDPTRIFLVGHSNGGFMTHRMACEHADVIASIATLAGSTWDDPSKCQPSEPVSALVLHGTLDPVIHYGGGQLFGNSYPGAVETAESWAKLDGCGASGIVSPTKLDLIGTFLAETTVTWWPSCAPGIDVEHWRIEAGTHVLLFKDEWKKRLFDFFDAHPKP